MCSNRWRAVGFLLPVEKKPWLSNWRYFHPPHMVGVFVVWEGSWGQRYAIAVIFPRRSRAKQRWCLGDYMCVSVRAVHLQGSRQTPECGVVNRLCFTAWESTEGVSAIACSQHVSVDFCYILFKQSLRTEWTHTQLWIPADARLPPHDGARPSSQRETPLAPIGILHRHGAHCLSNEKGYQSFKTMVRFRSPRGTFLQSAAAGGGVTDSGFTQQLKFCLLVAPCEKGSTRTRRCGQLEGLLPTQPILRRPIWGGVRLRLTPAFVFGVERPEWW